MPKSAATDDEECPHCTPFISSFLARGDPESAAAPPEGPRWTANAKPGRAGRSTAGYWFDYHPSLTSLANAADRCSFCAVLRSVVVQERESGSVGKHSREFVGDNDRVRLYFGTTDYGGGFRLSIGDVPHRDGVEFEVYRTAGASNVDGDEGILDSQSTAYRRFPLRKQIHSHPLDPEVVALAQKWIRDCCNDHWQCPSAGSALPTRLVDVGTDSHSVSTNLRLHISTAGERGEYVALSHRWTKDVERMGRTLPDNVQERENGFTSVGLPQAFQDAIAVTRRLGYRYIWIDSICIIQDPQSGTRCEIAQQDWQAEAARMGSYYGGAVVTLSPLQCKDSTQGFLRPRYGEDGRGDCLVPGYEHEGFRVRSVSELLGYRVNNSVLTTRGWILQERMLSPRVLHFTDKQMMWECTIGHVQENGSKGSGLVAGPGTLRTDMKVDPDKLQDILLQKWCSAVQEYTAKNLSVASDRLPAIAGVATEFAAKTNFTYLAGIWKEDLLRGLLWFLQKHRKAPESTGVDPSMPSWTWAKFVTTKNDPALVNYRTRLTTKSFVLDKDFSVLDASVQTHGPPAMGHITSTSLTLRARIAKTRYRNKGRRRDLALLLMPSGAALLNFGTLFSTDFDLEVDGECWCVRAANMVISRQDFVNTCVLVLKEGEGPGTYRRVGLGWIRPEHDEDLFRNSEVEDIFLQ